MRSFLPLVLLSALCLGPDTAPATAAEDGAPVTVRRALFRVPGTATRHAVALDLRFDGFVVDEDFDLETHGVIVSVAGVDLVTIPSETGRIRSRGDRFAYRMRDGRARTRLALDTRSGRLRLRMIGSDVSALAAASPDGAAVTLTVGDQVFETSVDFRTREARKGGAVWAHRAPRPPRLRPGPIPPPGGDGGLVIVASGGHSSVDEARDVSATSQAELDALWELLGPGAPAKPTVDFDQDIVVASFLGLRPSSGYGVAFTSAVAQSTGDVVVKRSAFKPGLNCFVLTVLTAPWAVATVTKPTGAVRFEKGVPLREQPCPGGRVGINR